MNVFPKSTVSDGILKANCLHQCGQVEKFTRTIVGILNDNVFRDNHVIRFPFRWLLRQTFRILRISFPSVQHEALQRVLWTI